MAVLDFDNVWLISWSSTTVTYQQTGPLFSERKRLILRMEARLRVIEKTEIKTKQAVSCEMILSNACLVGCIRVGPRKKKRPSIKRISEGMRVFWYLDSFSRDRGSIEKQRAKSSDSHTYRRVEKGLVQLDDWVLSWDGGRWTSTFHSVACK